MSIAEHILKSKEVINLKEASEKPNRPKDPTLSGIPDLYVEPVYLDSLQLHETIGDAGYLYQERMKQILVSDHPMLVEAVKKLYLLGKLCLPEDNTAVNDAQKRVIETHYLQEQTQIENDRRVAQHRRSLNEFYANLNNSRVKVIESWNELVDVIAAKFNEEPKRTPIKRLPIRLQHFVEVVTTNKRIFGNAIVAKWHQERPVRLDGFKLEINPLDPSKVNINGADDEYALRAANSDNSEYAKILLQEYARVHKTFMMVEINRIQNLIENTPEHRQLRKEVEREVRHLEKYANDRTWMYYDNSITPRGVKYNEYGSYSGDHGGNIRTVHMSVRDQVQQAQNKLYESLIRATYDALKQLQDAGEDGYDEIYPDHFKLKLKTNGAW